MSKETSDRLLQKTKNNSAKKMPKKSSYESNVLPHLKKIPKWFEKMTETQIAKKLGVAHCTFIKYKREHPELASALEAGKHILETEVRSALKTKAVGFTYTEKKVTRHLDADGHLVSEIVEEFTRYSPPDTGACHLLLKNLCDDWRNDDAETMKMKREKLALDRQKAEAETW